MNEAEVETNKADTDKITDHPYYGSDSGTYCNHNINPYSGWGGSSFQPCGLPREDHAS